MESNRPPPPQHPIDYAFQAFVVIGSVVALWAGVLSESNAVRVVALVIALQAAVRRRVGPGGAFVAFGVSELAGDLALLDGGV